MGIFDIFRRPPKNTRYAQTLNGYSPVYGQYGATIYNSDAVQQCLYCIVNEMKKLNPTHIRMKGDDPVPVRGNIQELLDEPNPLMTTSEFIEKTMWMLLLNENAFIVPVYEQWWDDNGTEHRLFKALYPINPTQVDFIEDRSGRLYVQFLFNNGYSTTIPYENVIHLKSHYSVNQFMGGNEMGQPDLEALNATLKLNREILASLAKAMNASYAVNGVVKYNTLLDNGKMEAALRELEQKLANSENGFLPIDMKAEFIPLERKSSLVDADTLKFVDEKILRNYGVSLPILTGDYTKEQYEAFYQKTLEPFIVSWGQAFTKKIFTKRERAFGNRIEFYPEALVFLTMGQTLEMIDKLSPTGALFENEKRVALGLRPLPELEGKRYMSLNWIDAEKANTYQIGNVDVVDEVKEDM